jgi:hypothetical protein
MQSPSPVTNIAYNLKNAEQIGGGCYNGLVGNLQYILQSQFFFLIIYTLIF